jgi:hypothetical protein
MRKLLVVSMTMCSLLIGHLTAHATEGGSSYYFPAASATFAVAVAPAPGLDKQGHYEFVLQPAFPFMLDNGHRIFLRLCYPDTMKTVMLRNS